MTSAYHSPLRPMVYAAMFGALTAAGSFMVIPIQPVPITLQTMFTCLAGVLLGSRAGAMSQMIYVLLGLIGLPVFAGGRAGLGTLLGPTGGYLLGFILGAYVIGYLVERKPEPGWAWTIMSMAAGNLVIYACGWTQLVLLTQFSWSKAFIVGVMPFLVGDGLKILAAAYLAPRLQTYFDLRGQMR